MDIIATIGTIGVAAGVVGGRTRMMNSAGYVRRDGDFRLLGFNMKDILSG